LTTYALIILKGLPSFALSDPLTVLSWIFHVTWMAALLAGFLVAALVWKIVQETPAFTQPYDFGRCFSLGAVVGALAEAVSTWCYRYFSHRPFSSFWIAGATIAGCLIGALTTAVVLARRKNLPA
jgi:uncharacterized membrane protein